MPRVCRYADDEAIGAGSDDDSLLSSVPESNENDDPNRTTGQSTASNGKHYDYCFTLNNYSLPDDVDFIREFSQECVYLVYQYERGESGTPHFQGYFRFKSRRAFGAIRKRLSRNGQCRFHLESRRGTVEQAIAYCTDECKRDKQCCESIVEYGIRPIGSGTRNDIRNCYNLVKSGTAAKDLYEQCTEVMVKYSRGMQACRILFENQRDFKTIVKWYYGSTGTGKSRAACDDSSHATTYWKSGASKWWDGYDGQETVIIDDYRCDLCPFHSLLRLFDRYPMQVEGKGTVHQFRSKLIIVTAPCRPEVMWRTRCQEDMGQLLRRIEEIKLFGEEPSEPSILPTFNI